MPLAASTWLQQRYRIERLLGRGGLGCTYLAHDAVMDTRVALKVLENPSPQRLAVFRSEFLALRGLLHPNLLRVRDFAWLQPGEVFEANSNDGVEPSVDGATAASCCFVSEFVDGSSLDVYAASLSSWQGFVPLAQQILQALNFLHRVGFRHGDIKPANVLVDTSGRAVVIDLSCGAPLSSHPDGLVAGTPGFIAPELLRGDEVDQRADLYSFGVMLQRIVAERRWRMPPQAQQTLQRLSAERPAERPSSVAEVLELFGCATLETPAVLAPPAQLLGRDDALQTFDSLLQQVDSGRSGPRGLWLHGEAGIGCSRLLQELKWTASLHRNTVEAVGPAAIAEMLRRATKTAQSISSAADLWSWREGLSRQSPPILLVDDADLLEGQQAELLQALWRSLEPDDGFVLVCAAHRPPLSLNAAHLSLPLPALQLQQVREWVDGLVPDRKLAELMKCSDGHPGRLQRGLSHMVALRRHGDDSETSWPEWFATASTSQSVTTLAKLTTEERRALGLVAVMNGQVDAAVVDAARLTLEDLTSLQVQGWLQYESSGWRLCRRSDADPIAALLPDQQRRDLHRWAAGFHGDRRLALGEKDLAARSHHHAQASYHLAAAGDWGAALTALQSGLLHCGQHAAAWQRAADALAAASATPLTLLAVAKIFEHTGKPEVALRHLGRLLRQRRLDAIGQQARLQVASCLVRQGEARRAMRYLQELSDAAATAPWRCVHAELHGRALLKIGEYRGAQVVAETTLQSAAEKDESAGLHEVAGLAASYLGDHPNAQRHLRQAADLQRSAGDIAAHLRNRSYLAFDAFRQGDAETAASGYRDVLRLAESHGHVDLIATGSLNLGTTCHQLGDWGEALAAYHRSLQLARALDRRSSEVTAGFNLAKLFVDIGAMQRALITIERAEATAAAVGMPFFTAALLALRGERAYWLSQDDEAQTTLRSAAQKFAVVGADREVAETKLWLGRSMCRSGQLQAAADLLEDATYAIESLQTADLKIEHALLHGELLSASKRHQEALPLLEGAMAAAQRLHRRDLDAVSAGLLASAYAAQSAHSLAAAQSERARQLWERIAASLPSEMRDAFWQHPQRSAMEAHQGGSSRQGSSEPSRAEVSWQRLAIINRQINSSLDLLEVLRCTMDAAIALTGAERGFLLLKKGTGPTRRRRHQGADDKTTFEVVVTRNMSEVQDLTLQEPSAEPRFDAAAASPREFSRSIAEHVLRTGTALLSTDAQQDLRFDAQGSVHAMGLKSVIAAPIRRAEQTLGILYLDSRFQRDRFGSQHMDVLSAFADQAALALYNASLHAELQQRSAQLMTEKRRVDTMLRRQNDELGALQTRLRWQQRHLERRYRYEEIAGSSSAMQSVLDLIDRVVDATLNVLISGESGTGKELVARAIHFSGPRKAQPFVSLNCAALPDNLLESELFGHVRGAFSGADRDRVGLFVQADGGTLFLDELGEMSTSMQVKLLRVLQEREVRPLGTHRNTPIDIRLICATNRKLRDEVAAGRFREDLFYRIGVVEIEVPPLRARLQDIPELAEHLLKRIADRLGSPKAQLSQAALRSLMAYAWPGNIRELDNVLTKAAAFATSPGRIEAADIELGGSSLSRLPQSRDEHGRDETQTLLAALQQHRWNVSEVSRALGIPRATLYRKLKRYGVLRSSLTVE